MLRFWIIVLWCFSASAGAAEDLCQRVSVVAKEINCFKEGRCIVAAKADSLSCFKPGDPILLYQKDILIMAGSINSIRMSYGKKEHRVIELDGQWLASARYDKLKKKTLQLYYDDNPNRTAPAGQSQGNSNFGRFVELRNDRNEALFAVIGKTGSPLAPSSNYGAAVELNKIDKVPFDLHFGNYIKPNFVGAESESRSLLTYGVGAGILFGSRGSFVKPGLSANNTHLRFGDGHTRTYTSLIPTIGIRIVSDSEIIFLYEMSKNFSLNGNLAEDLGNAPTDLGIFKGRAVDMCLGLGMGI